MRLAAKILLILGVIFIVSGFVVASIIPNILIPITTWWEPKGKALPESGRIIFEGPWLSYNLTFFPPKEEFKDLFLKGRFLIISLLENYDVYILEPDDMIKFRSGLPFDSLYEARDTNYSIFNIPITKNQTDPKQVCFVVANSSPEDKSPSVYIEAHLEWSEKRVILGRIVRAPVGVIIAMVGVVLLLVGPVLASILKSIPVKAYSMTFSRRVSKASFSSSS